MGFIQMHMAAGDHGVILRGGRRPVCWLPACWRHAVTQAAAQHKHGINRG